MAKWIDKLRCEHNFGYRSLIWIDMALPVHNEIHESSILSNFIESPSLGRS